MNDLNEEQILKYITDEIENDKEYINWMKQNNIKDDLDRKKCHLEKSINARQGLLDLYKKKSKMVDLMAENLTTPTHDKEWVIKYFEGEVELEDEN